MEGLIHFIVAFSAFLLGAFIESLLTKLSNYKEKSESIPKCKCDDCSQCDTWCIAKENFTQAQCNHPEEAIRMRTVDACVTCEKVEHYCTQCGKVICSITDCV